MPKQDESYSLEKMLEAAKVDPLDNEDRIYSNEVREIISSRPAWIVRNGIALFFIIIALLFTLTYFIQYPDLVKAPVRIVGKNLPKQMISKVEGRIVRLAAKDNSNVLQGDALAILQSNADYEQVLTFELWVNQTEEQLSKQQWIAIKNLPPLNNLGDWQKNYQDIQQQLYQLSWSMPSGYLDLKKQSIRKDLNLITELTQNANEQKKLIQQELDMQQNLLSINERLVKEKVIAPLDLDKDKSMVIAKKQQLIQVDAGNINQNANELSKEKELVELSKSSMDIRQNFITALLNAKSAIAEWKNRYMVVATENGKLQFTSYFQTNSWIKAGQELFTIIPNQPDYFAEIIASQQNFGKIKKGQQVNIALSSYQRNEFGILKGVIENIPAVPYKDTAFLIRVQLSNGLITNYKKQIQFSNNLTGIAEIITADVSLADRLLYQWRGLFKR
jgi:HlyD family secretion protein